MTVRTQQEEVYTAQRVLPAGLRFDGRADAQRYVDTLRDEPWWEQFFPLVEDVEVHVGPCGAGWGGVAAFHEGERCGVIQLDPNGGMTQATIVHELAHILANAHRESTGHDPAFVRTFLELVYHTYGSEAWQGLKASFLQHGVVIDEREDV